MSSKEYSLSVGRSSPPPPTPTVSLLLLLCPSRSAPRDKRVTSSPTPHPSLSSVTHPACSSACRRMHACTHACISPGDLPPLVGIKMETTGCAGPMPVPRRPPTPAIPLGRVPLRSSFQPNPVNSFSVQSRPGQSNPVPILSIFVQSNSVQSSPVFFSLRDGFYH